MKLIDMLDPEIMAAEANGEYVVWIESDYGNATIEVPKWVGDMALSKGREAVEEASEEYQNLFDKVEAALND